MSIAKRAPPLKIELQIVTQSPEDNNFVKLSHQEYYELLEKLTSQGIGASKKSSVIAFPLVTFGVETLNNAGSVETLKDFTFGHRLVFDPSLYSVAQAKKVTRAVFKAYGDLLVSAPDELVALLNSGKAELRVVASGEGFWTTPNRNFLTDYEPDQHIRSMYNVKPETSRLCLPVDRNFNMPVKWGDFNMRMSGTIAARMGDVESIVSALDAIKSGEKSIEDALYTPDGKALFDVYGMDPGFFKANYQPAKVSREAFNALAKRQGIESLSHEGAQAPGLKRLLGGWSMAQFG